MAGRDDATPGSATDKDQTPRETTEPGEAAATRPSPPQASPPRPGDDRTTVTPAAVDERADGRSLGQLVASATRDLSALIRGEIALAKAELKQSATAVGKGAGMFGAAAILAFIAVLMLSTAAAYGFVAAGLHPAVGFVIVGGAWLLLAGLLVYAGLRSVRKARPPERTIHSLEEARRIVSRGNTVTPSQPSTPDGSSRS